MVSAFDAELERLLAETRQPVRRGGSKRCSNRRLRASGYRFIYPDYRCGYADLPAS